MNSNKDSAVVCMLTASCVLSTICTIFIFLTIFTRSWTMGLIALDTFLIMGAVIISAFIIDDSDEYGDIPLLVNLLCCIVFAVEYYVMVVGKGVFNIVKFIFTFLAVAFSCMYGFISHVNLKKKGDDNNEKI